jgi:hypothetical protein
MATTKTAENTTKARETKAADEKEVKTESAVNQAANTWAETLREAGKTVAESASTIQDSNIQFAQSLIEQGFKQAESQTAALHKLYTTLASHSAERREAFRNLAREAAAASISSLGAPAKFTRRGFAAMREAVRTTTEE